MMKGYFHEFFAGTFLLVYIVRMSNGLISSVYSRNVALILFLFLCSIAHGQQVFTFEDSLQVGKYKGIAKFGYKVVENDTVLHGPFQMQRSSLKALLKQSDHSFSFAGNFIDDYPNGEWKFEFGEFQSDSVTKVLDYQYLLNITGVREKAFGQLVEGKPDGLWTIEKSKIDDSKISRTLFKSKIDFKNGVPQKSFQIENDSSILVGRFLRNGLAHDEWTIYSESDIDIVESWSFTDGRLQKVERSTEGEITVANFYKGQLPEERTIVLDEDYLKILNIVKKTRNSFDLTESSIYKTLKENSKYYAKIDSILSELGQSAFYPRFKVKVPYYPLDSINYVQLDSIEALYVKSNGISESLIKDTQLNILKMADDDALFFHSVLMEISKGFLNPLARILDYHESDIIQYVSNDELILHVWPNGKPSKQITVALKGNENRTFTGPNAEKFDFSKQNIASVYDIARYAFQSIDSIQQILNDKLTKDKREQEFIALEERIIERVNQLNNDLDSLKQGLSRDYIDVFEQIKSTANKDLSEYSKMEETKSKKKLGTELVGCLESMDELANAVAMQPNREEEIVEKYQDAIWNPFMATIMNEEVKKRITTAYNKILIPYIFERIENELNCENVDELVSLLNNTHRRMLEMRDEDTSKLERKLKKEQDALKIIQLFNLQPISETEK